MNEIKSDRDIVSKEDKNFFEKNAPIKGKIRDIEFTIYLCPSTPDETRIMFEKRRDIAPELDEHVVITNDGVWSARINLITETDIPVTDKDKNQYNLKRDISFQHFGKPDSSTDLLEEYTIVQNPNEKDNDYEARVKATLEDILAKHPEFTLSSTNTFVRKVDSEEKLRPVGENIGFINNENSSYFAENPDQTYHQYLDLGNNIMEQYRDELTPLIINAYRSLLPELEKSFPYLNKSEQDLETKKESAEPIPLKDRVQVSFDDLTSQKLKESNLDPNNLTDQELDTQISDAENNIALKNDEISRLTKIKILSELQEDNAELDRRIAELREKIPEKYLNVYAKDEGNNKNIGDREDEQ